MWVAAYTGAFHGSASCGKTVVMPVRTASGAPSSPRITVRCPTRTPATSVIAFMGPGVPVPIRMPSSRARRAVIGGNPTGPRALRDAAADPRACETPWPMKLPRSLKTDVLAGLPGAIGSVPDGMAASVLTGVNPIHGLYASFAGPIAGGAVASTRRMVVATTSAAALAAGSAVAGLQGQDRVDGLLLLTLMAGALMVLAGVLHLGRLTRFVSHSVMIGFLTGVAVNIILGQLPDLTGTAPEGNYALAKALDVLLHPSEIDPASLLTGLGAIAILVLTSKTKIANVGALIALAVPTAIAFVAGADVQLVADVGTIPTGLPIPLIPDLSLLSLDLVVGALAVTAIVLVQGAGVAESAPNPDGSIADANRDFIAQGAGNLASGLFRGQPVGGSVGQTALNIAAGARGRWASIASGVWMVLILVLFSGLVGQVAIPTLAGVLIVAAIGALRPAEIRTILRTGRISQVALITTLLCTLFLPIAAAVGIGVAISLLLQLNREAMDLVVVELVPREDGVLEERPAPATLTDDRVVLLDAYGSLLYAGARTLQARLPDPSGAERPVVVLRLRGRTAMGSTFFVVVSDYAERLRRVDGRLYLSGVGEPLMRQMREDHVLDVGEPIKLYEATSTIGASSRAAYEDAQAWLLGRAEREDPEEHP